jgi:hypothetical protein
MEGKLPALPSDEGVGGGGVSRKEGGIPRRKEGDIPVRAVSHKSLGYPGGGGGGISRRGGEVSYRKRKYPRKWKGIPG